LEKPKIVSKKLVKQLVVQKTKKTIVPKHIADDIKIPTRKIAHKKIVQKYIDNKKDEKRAIFINKLKARINKNKFYPKKAIMRHIQGDVKVEFIIQNDGNVRDIKIISGRRIFKRAIIRSIKDSFPIEVDTKLFNFPKKFTINLRFRLR
ncbi:MAG: energy transducer TonB, partial [Campylobacteraceae bacterium]|nr:energy transducer TonB [Campylobacteraceae bacterium]